MKILVSNPMFSWSKNSMKICWSMPDHPYIAKLEKNQNGCRQTYFFIKYRCAKHIITNFCIQCFMVTNGLQMAKSTPMKNIRDVTKKNLGVTALFGHISKCPPSKSSFGNILHNNDVGSRVWCLVPCFLDQGIN